MFVQCLCACVHAHAHIRTLTHTRTRTRTRTHTHAHAHMHAHAHIRTLTHAHTHTGLVVPGTLKCHPKQRSLESPEKTMTYPNRPPLYASHFFGENPPLRLTLHSRYG